MNHSVLYQQLAELFKDVSQITNTEARRRLKAYWQETKLHGVSSRQSRCCSDNVMPELFFYRDRIVVNHRIVIVWRRTV